VGPIRAYIFFQAMLGKKVNTDRKNTDKIKVTTQPLDMGIEGL
jgi:hypothetical protein